MILTILQARMSSTRLPGKVLKDLAGKPMLQWVVDAAIDSNMVDSVIVATSKEKSDSPITKYCKENKIPCATGSLDDVLDRFYQVAMPWRPTHIVRLTADCPLLTGDIIDRTIERYLLGRYDYAVNAVDGLDVEVFTYAELLRAHKLAASPAYREHVTPFIRECRYEKSEDCLYRPDVAKFWTFSVNTPEEFERMEKILSNL